MKKNPKPKTLLGFQLVSPMGAKYGEKLEVYSSSTLAWELENNAELPILIKNGNYTITPIFFGDLPNHFIT